ncbi:MAG: ATP-binding protein [Bacteroidales bacterium]|nr:ATP-binding protein [Bacteroidales bacterium]
MYIPRQITPVLHRTIDQFPVTMITGPRQSGKTTLLKETLTGFRYVNLEDPDFRTWAVEQPKDFLHNNPPPIIIDEAQHAPDLFSYIQLLTDEKQDPGMFVLSGSQNFSIMEKITQSLAGRCAILTLFPFAFNELPDSFRESKTNVLIHKGFFPRLYQTVYDIPLFYQSYITTYIEKDVRQLANIGNLQDFTRFMKLCAGRAGQLLNIASLATEVGIAYNTCKSWLSYLVTGNIIRLVSQYHKSFNKKVVKTPKLMFTDTGLLCNLLGITNEQTLSIHPFRGEIFENHVYMELVKQLTNRGMLPDLAFWRDNHKTEVDFILDQSPSLIAIEVKSGMNVQPSYVNNLKRFSSYNQGITIPYLIYDGDLERVTDNIKVLNWRNSGEVLHG